MQTFQLSFTSRIYFLIYLMAGILVTSAIIALLSFAGLDALTDILVVVAVIYVFYQSFVLSKQRAVFSITDTGLQIEWVNRPWLLGKKDRLVPWSNIASYLLEPDRMFKEFELLLHSGEKLSFTISTLNDQEKQFNPFYRAFVTKVDSLKANETGEPVTIERKAPFYETVIGTAFLIIAALVLIGSVIYSLFN